MHALLYYDVIVAKDMAMLPKSSGILLAQYALGIAAGASLIWTLNDIIKKACTALLNKN